MLLGQVAWGPAHADTHTENASQSLEQILRTPTRVSSVPDLDWRRLEAFYRPRGYRPVWTEGKKRLARARLLRDALQMSGDEGLDPGAFHLREIEREWSSPATGSQVTLELLLTDAFLQYSVHARSGRLRPEKVDPNWHIKPVANNDNPFVWLTLPDRKFSNMLRSLPPQHAGYKKLRVALAHYRQIENDGGWPPIPHGPGLQQGDHDRRVGFLRLRLMAEGDLIPGSVADATHFDKSIHDAVQRFQQRHGLKADGIVGSSTRAAMNLPVAQRIHQIKLNMERWRWLPRDLGDRYVTVNTAGYVLEVHENSKRSLQMRVIAGQKEHETPVLSGVLDAVQFNPYWIVPSEIAAEELLPKQQADTSYFASQGFRVFDKWGEDARELELDKIKWWKFNEKNFTYKVRQDPGPNNALGRMKFLFANDFAIFLHDTPHRKLFNAESRDLSHGCIRVEQPAELAAYLLADNGGWTRERMQEVIDSGETRSVRLKRPVPLYLVYWTAWVSPGYQVNFREDIYERDLQMSKNREKLAILEFEPKSC